MFPPWYILIHFTFSPLFLCWYLTERMTPDLESCIDKIRNYSGPVTSVSSLKTAPPQWQPKELQPAPCPSPSWSETDICDDVNYYSQGQVLPHHWQSQLEGKESGKGTWPTGSQLLLEHLKGGCCLSVSYASWLGHNAPQLSLACSTHSLVSCSLFY